MENNAGDSAMNPAADDNLGDNGKNGGYARQIAAGSGISSPNPTLSARTRSQASALAKLPQYGDEDYALSGPKAKRLAEYFEAGHCTIHPCLSCVRRMAGSGKPTWCLIAHDTPKAYQEKRQMEDGVVVYFMKCLSCTGNPNAQCLDVSWGILPHSALF